MRVIAISIVPLLATLAGCGGAGDQTYTIEVAPLVGGAPFACGQSYPNIGTTQSTITPMDFRVYVHGVSLVKASGEKQPLALTPDGKWQSDSLALLDFEDGTGACATSSPETNTKLVGTAPSGDYVGVELTIGLPADQDHLAAATAPAPLNEPAMFWGWLGGYRYVKLDLQTTVNTGGYFFHLGAQDCSGTTQDNIQCLFPNLAPIALQPFTPGKSRIAFDIATLLADADVDLQPDGVTTFTPGCMSAPGDPQCPAIYAKLGLAFEGQGSAPPQTVLTVQ